ncbi:MAG: SUMF1/EgtB/PvdO family nonheme iron enzyme [Bacteroidota bacterium]|nr:SUMF1/EgtB/PvdO family nonheme iron enzyme [Bacteroidota bacterium]
MRRRTRHTFLPFCLIALLLPSFVAFSQSFTLFPPDARDYPLLRADFYVFDAEGHRVLDLTAGEFVLTENGEPRRIVHVECPPMREPTAISAVLTIDVSGSMSGEGLTLAREAAAAWIDAFPAGASECALTSFTTRNALHQDFTNDKALLRVAVAGMQSGGGTSFDAALLHPFAGALPVAARGRHSKVIVLLTDGHATGSERAIIDEARRIGARIFCITLDNIMPDVLRHIAEETGGQCFEHVTTVADARRIYRSILELAQDIPPCVITWESGGCAYFRDVRCEVPAHGIVARGAYSVTDDDLPRLVVEPGRVIEFGAVAPGASADRTVTVRGEGRTVDITAIAPEFPLFVITDYGGPPPPFTLSPGEERRLTVRYTAEDSAYIICRFMLESNACEGGFFATAGAPGSGRDRRVIRLLHPNGGEVFVAGSDTVITWEGVAPTDPVRLEYSTNNGVTWKMIANNVTGLSYTWRVPNTPSDECLARVTAPLQGALPDDMVIIPAGSFIMGDINGTGTSEERPTSRVTITRAFLMTRTEVTRHQWMQYTGGTEPGGKGPGDGPASRMSPEQMMAYCNWRSQQEGLQECYSFNGGTIYCDFFANGYRLPTEAEWEYACRAGVSEDYYTGPMLEPYCSPVDPRLDIAGWYCGNTSDMMPNPQTVGQKRPNAFGLYDMHGNVRELCWGDMFTPYTAEDKIDPTGPNPLTKWNPRTHPVTRGGWSRGNAAECRSSSRVTLPWGIGMDTSGFRLVRTY